MSYFGFLVGFLCICVWQTHASTPLLCDEPNTEASSCKNECSDKCPKVPPQACTLNCVPGCYCKQDYSRGANGTCIPTENCPVQCNENEVFGRRCTDTCDEDRIRCKQTIYGCYCKPGLKRINGKCVSEANCYNCTKNEEYNECKNPCYDICPGPEPIFCPAFCQKGCVCKRNFKRDPETNECIPIEKCKVKCPSNSTFGSVCDDSCQKDEIRCITVNYRCACDTGFSRINGTCQPDSLCPENPINE